LLHQLPPVEPVLFEFADEISFVLRHIRNAPHLPFAHIHPATAYPNEPGPRSDVSVSE
jgi:hypothetical protein